MDLNSLASSLLGGLPGGAIKQSSNSLVDRAPFRSSLHVVNGDAANLAEYRGTHPAVMSGVVAAASWGYSPRLDSRPRRVRLGIAILKRPFAKLAGRIWRKST